MLKPGLLGLFLLGLATTAGAQPTVLVVGDSLSAAYGITLEKGWVALLQKRIKQQGYPHQVINASVSGETTAGGLSRIPAALKKHKPAVVLIELGANDGLRGMSLEPMRINLSQMIQLSRAAGARPVLFEMRMFANYGEPYTNEFHRSFRQLAKGEKVPLVPFFLAEIVPNPKYLQPDGLHPTAEAQPKMLDAVWRTVEPLIKATGSAKPP